MTSQDPASPALPVSPPCSCSGCRAMLNALETDMDVLTSLTLIVASVASRAHGRMFEHALSLEYERLSTDSDPADEQDGRLVIGLLGEMIDQLS